MPFSSESANLSVTQPITPRTQIFQSPQIRHPFQTKATTFQVPKLTLEQTENSQTKQKEQIVGQCQTKNLARKLVR